MTKKAVVSVILLLVAVLSFTVLTPIFSAPERYEKTFETLDKKRTQVLEMTAGSAGAATMVAALPGDSTTPIADELANLSSFFIIVLCAILLEKYMLTITIYVAFRYLFPAALVLLAISMFWDNPTVKRFAAKLIAFGVVLCLVIPASVGVSNMIESTYQDSINEILSETEESSSSTESESVQETETESETEASNEKTSFADKIKNFVNSTEETVSDKVSDAADKITDTTSELLEEAKTLLNHYVEAIAVLLLTSCVIPVLVILFFLWFIKLILEINIAIPSLKGINGKGPGFKLRKPEKPVQE